MGFDGSDILQFAGQIGFVGAQIKQAVAGQIENDDALLASLARPLRFHHDGGNRMRRLRRGTDAFRARKECPGLKNFRLAACFASIKPSFSAWLTIGAMP